MMSLEIERKFLPKGTSPVWRELATSKIEIVQAYLFSDPEKTIRVRIENGDAAILCIKGQSSGISTPEYEVPIHDLEKAWNIIKLCGANVLTKTRYLVPVDDHVFEVDEFSGRLLGLTVIEVELKSEDEDFPRPDWFGKEVTLDPRYKNALLVRDGLPA
jgi:adenylate cyclase